MRSALRRDMPCSISSSCCQANLRDSGGSNELSVTGSYACACSPAVLVQLPDKIASNTACLPVCLPHCTKQRPPQTRANAPVEQVTHGSTRTVVVTRAFGCRAKNDCTSRSSGNVICRGFGTRFRVVCKYSALTAGHTNERQRLAHGCTRLSGYKTEHAPRTPDPSIQPARLWQGPQARQPVHLRGGVQRASEPPHCCPL